MRVASAANFKDCKCVRLYKDRVEARDLELYGVVCWGPQILASIQEAAKLIDCCAQVGNGVRFEKDVELCLELGANGAVPDRIAVSVDSVEGIVADGGWTTVSSMGCETAVAWFLESCVCSII